MWLIRRCLGSPPMGSMETTQGCRKGDRGVRMARVGRGRPAGSDSQATWRRDGGSRTRSGGGDRKARMAAQGAAFPSRPQLPRLVYERSVGGDPQAIHTAGQAFSFANFGMPV